MLRLITDTPITIEEREMQKQYYRGPDSTPLVGRFATKHLDVEYPWIITYDDCQLVRDLYRKFHMQEYDISHNAGGTIQGKEIVITNLPVERFRWDS